MFLLSKESTWPWSYSGWIYNYLCSQCLPPLKLWVRIPLSRRVLDTTLCDKVCQWLATGRWFSQGTLVSFANKTDFQNITEISLKVALNTITLTLNLTICPWNSFTHVNQIKTMIYWCLSGLNIHKLAHGKISIKLWLAKLFLDLL